MLDLSTIIDDLLTGKAVIKDFAETYQAGAGAAISATTFTCPANTIRLVLGGTFASVKTTGTLVTLAWRNRYGDAITGHVGTIIQRTIPNTNEQISIPIDEGSDRDVAEMNPQRLWLMTSGDYLLLTHALTAAETIADQLNLRYIEWQTAETKKEPVLEEPRIQAPSPTMGGVTWWK